MRSMDRGILASDTLMKYMFLWLIPAISECLIVCLIFAIKFDYIPLAVTLFFFVYMYCLLTVILTLWRKRFRKAVNTHDNKWHDIATDSLINFETVKYFEAEKVHLCLLLTCPQLHFILTHIPHSQHEEKRFGNAIKDFQNHSVAVQASLSFLNTTQQVLLQLCLALCLILAVDAIKQKNECCVATFGCEENDHSCCSDKGGGCSGMEVGDFVAVLSYVLNLFAPLNFLGSVYNAIIMAIVDLANLSSLLREEVTITDSPSASVLNFKEDGGDEDIIVEFKDVKFHYKSQTVENGLRGLNLAVKKGTYTAIVGPTGAGKTTISRLLFRFYDVNEGAVFVNGQDIRTITQGSLRSSIGVVPQDTPLFNDTIRYNIAYGNRDCSQEDLERVAKDAQIIDFIESLEDGWDTAVGERGLKLR